MHINTFSLISYALVVSVGECTLMRKESRKISLDALGEVAVIGAGHASNVLSEVLDCEIMLQTPQIKVVTLMEALKIIREQKELLVEVYARVSGDINGIILVVFDRKGARELADIIIESVVIREKVPILDNLGRDAIKEVSNIMMGSYLTALNKFLGVRMYHHVPMLMFTLTEKSMMDFIKHSGLDIKYALFASTGLKAKEKSISCSILLLFDTKSKRLILKELERKTGECDL